MATDLEAIIPIRRRLMCSTAVFLWMKMDRKDQDIVYHEVKCSTLRLGMEYFPLRLFLFDFLLCYIDQFHLLSVLLTYLDVPQRLFRISRSLE